MKTLFLITILILTGALCHAGQKTGVLSDDVLAQIKFDQRLNQKISRELVFRDENGKSVRLGEYFGRRPVIFVLGYYECPMLCSLTLNGLIEAMQDIKLDVGKDFEIVNVSIDPKETPALAAAKQHIYLKRYGRKGAESGWHFLTGNEAEIRQLAKEVGFNYVYDPQSGQFAHPSGIVIVTPDARISHYIFGVTYSASDLDVALRDADQRRIGSPIQQFFLLCFHYAPFTGRYGAEIMAVVRFSGLAALAALGCLVWRNRSASNARAPGLVEESTK